MKAMILAAGVGSRLSPLTLFMPKPMAPIANKPVMEHIIDLLASHGVKEIAANLNYLPDQIESYFGDGQRWGVKLTYSLERTLLGTAGAVRRISNFFNGPFWVLMGDSLTDVDLGAMHEFHRQKGALATIALHPVDDPTRFGVVQLQEDGRILRFQEKPKRQDACSNLVNMGVYLFEPSILEKIPPGEVYDFGHQLFPRLLDEGVPFYGYQSDCYWSDVGSFSEYRKAQAAVLNGNFNSVMLPYRQAGEKIWLGHGVSIHPKAQLVAPVLIGDNCQVRADAVIGPETVLGNNIVVDEGATITGSTVLEGTYVGRLVNVNEAVVNRNCLVSVPADTSVFVADRFLLGEVGEAESFHKLTRWLGWGVTLLLFILSLPLWILAGGLALFAGRGPLLEWQEQAVSDPQARQKTGKLGWHTVRIARFRADPDTSAGRLLRRLDLAGLPGFLAALRGQISLVGVGPLTIDQAQSLIEDWQQQRFKAPRGLTGLWYVNGDKDTQLDEQLVIDGYYAVMRNWKQDLKILWQTPGAYFRRLRLQ
jgi:NDP-sugar pyrophosphorylase family protein